MDVIRLIWALYFTVIGLCIGSFALATAWRIRKKRNFVYERSECEHCRHTLSLKDLVPILSWLSTRGRCRYCGKKLSAMLPLAELTGAVVYAISYLSWPVQLEGVYAIVHFVLWLAALVPLLILFFYDLQWYLLPTKVMKPLWVVSFFYACVTMLESPTWITLAGIATAVLVSRGLFWLFFMVSKGSWIGFGDVRLGLAIGLLVGTPAKAGVALFTASVLGLLITLPGLLSGSRKLSSKVPFGPLLIVGLVVAMLYGQALVDAYIGAIAL